VLSVPTLGATGAPGEAAGGDSQSLSQAQSRVGEEAASAWESEGGLSLNLLELSFRRAMAALPALKVPQRWNGSTPGAGQSPAPPRPSPLWVGPSLVLQASEEAAQAPGLGLGVRVPSAKASPALEPVPSGTETPGYRVDVE